MIQELNTPKFEPILTNRFMVNLLDSNDKLVIPPYMIQKCQLPYDYNEMVELNYAYLSLMLSLSEFKIKNLKEMISSHSIKKMEFLLLEPNDSIWEKLSYSVNDITFTYPEVYYGKSDLFLLDLKLRVDSLG